MYQVPTWDFKVEDFFVATWTVSLLRLLALLALICGSVQSHALGLRCGDRLVRDGMDSAQVRNACGAPFWTDIYTSVEILGAGGPVEEQREIAWDVWYYNFGSTMFMQRLTFRDGRLQRIESLGYGVDEVGTACLWGAAARGLSSGELVARCGEPASRRLNDGALVRRAPGVLLASQDRREEWVYDSGGDYLTRYLITNSQVTGAERLPR